MCAQRHGRGRLLLCLFLSYISRRVGRLTTTLTIINSLKKKKKKKRRLNKQDQKKGRTGRKTRKSDEGMIEEQKRPLFLCFRIPNLKAATARSNL
jgi:hypothetical protein